MIFAFPPPHAYLLAVKGVVSQDEYFLNDCNNTKVLSVHALIVFTIFVS
jgi:hypothetical protein